MWLLSIFPDWVFNMILLVGVLGLVASFLLQFVPFTAGYKIPIQVISILLVVAGVWYQGGIAKDAEWKAKVAALELRASQAEAKSAEVNTVIVTKVVTKIQKVKEVVYVNKEIIKEVVGPRLDAICTLTAESVTIHDAAALNKAASNE